ncbi:Bifunctional protein GlmU [Dissostichus eleginoides]|uniref:Bifunctional protein GlmU n=1 Tax=Dissostichus eleginoides TaxID=100907 RepID=A0AAD9C086_DISEL|nr:Bifunctional protein GlmU [Dissostichus eleginoides]
MGRVCRPFGQDHYQTERRETLELTDQNGQVIEDILPALQSLKCATTALCSDVCISLEHPVSNSLLTRHLMSIPGESRVVCEFKEAVATSLRERIIPESDDTSANAGKKPVFIASGLDPRKQHLRHVALTHRSEIVENV